MSKVQDEAMTRLDSAVSEVFETMLERSCDPLEGEVDTVDFSVLHGCRELRLPRILSD